MSDNFTLVQPYECGEPVGGGWGMRNHQKYEKALSSARQYYESVRDEAERALAAITRGEVKVFHQRGVIVVRDRKEVTP